MIEIDGSAGGGQMLRTALSLSAITGKEFRIRNIRGKRPNSGLKRQHLEAVRAAGRISKAKIEGDEIESQTLKFQPQELESQSFTSNIGTAGSITLLYDTVLPITSQFNNSFRFTAKGGTDVKWSPAFSYFKEVKLPLLQGFGVKAEADLEKTGYYPKGGGKAVLRTEQHSMKPVKLVERGKLEKFEIYSKTSKELQDQKVADRQADEAERILKNSHMTVPVDKYTRYQKTASPGSSLTLKTVYENSIAGFDVLGEKGKRSEDIAKDVVQDFKRFHSSGAAVDRRMADQLMVFMAIIGGEIAIPEITDHVQTNMEVLRSFGFNISVHQDGKIVLNL